MIRLKNTKLILSGMLILPMTLAAVACSPIFADDPNQSRPNSLSAEINMDALKNRIQTAKKNEEISQNRLDKVIPLLKKKFNGRGINPFTLESMKDKLAVAVESGEISQEEADAKLVSLQAKKDHEKIHHKRHHHKKPMMDLEDINAKISAAVESGEITQDEADVKLADIEAKRNSRQQKMATKLESIKKKLADAVESGEITQEEARAKLIGLQAKKDHEKIHGKRHHHKKPMMDLELIKAKISAAVESGEITQEEADSKMLQYLEKEPEKRNLK